MSSSASSMEAAHEGPIPGIERAASFRPHPSSVGCTVSKESDDIEANSLAEQLPSQGFRFHSLFTRARRLLCGQLSRNSFRIEANEDKLNAKYLQWTKRFISEDYRKCPQGYPQLASFLDSCDDFSIYRRFGACHSRILTDYMADITSIEQELLHLDQCDSQSVGDNGTSYRLETRVQRQDSDNQKVDLLTQLASKLSVYDDLLLKYNQIKLLHQCSPKDHANVSKWIWLEKPLRTGQYDFIYRHQDFVSLGRQSHNRFEDAVKNILTFWLGSWFKKYIGMESLNDPNDQSVEYHSADRVTFFARLCVVFFAVLILYVPVVLFLLVSLRQAYMAVVTLAFVFAFSIIISLLPEARMMDIFLGSATYCAVLVTFLGNLKGATN